MDINVDLQATHQILKIFETAKSHGDEILDQSPGIYVVFGQDGEIYRGNVQLAKILRVDFESLHRHDLSEIMRAAQWQKFQEMFVDLIKDPL